MRIVHQLIFQAQDILVRPLVMREVRNLQQSQNAQARTIAQCVTDTFNTVLSDEELSLVESIERRRTSLILSNERIVMMDYGAESKNGAEQKTRIVGDVAVESSKPFRWALLLFKLIRAFKPKTCIELGTCLGVSGLYQAAALNLNGGGTLITLEGAKSYARIARKNFDKAGFGNTEIVVGRFQDTLEKTAQRIQPIDFAFIDGHHDGEATLRYFEMLYPFLSSRALILFDDIHWSSGMKRAWKKIDSDSRVALRADFRQIGIALIHKN